MKVSVVIAAWNNQQMLDKTLRDITRQTVRPDEVIVVDDGSDVPLVADTIVRLPIHSEPRTSGFARNEGVSKSSGDMIIICDHDQALVSDAVESIIKYGESIATARRYGLISDIDDPDAFSDGLPDEEQPDMEHCFAAMPRSVFYTVGGYDTESFSRWGWTNYDFSRRAMAIGIEIRAAKRLSGRTLYTFDRPHGFKRDYRSAANEYHAKYGHLSMNQECDSCHLVGLKYVGDGISNIPVFSDENP